MSKDTKPHCAGCGARLAVEPSPQLVAVGMGSGQTAPDHVLVLEQAGAAVWVCRDLRGQAKRRPRFGCLRELAAKAQRGEKLALPAAAVLATAQQLLQRFGR